MVASITIVMSIRENYSQTIQTIESLIKNTTLSYRFIFIDYKVPEFIKTYMNHQYKNIEIVTSDSPYPSKALHNIISNF